MSTVGLYDVRTTCQASGLQLHATFQKNLGYVEVYWHSRIVLYATYLGFQVLTERANYGGGYTGTFRGLSKSSARKYNHAEVDRTWDIYGNILWFFQGSYAILRQDGCTPRLRVLDMPRTVERCERMQAPGFSCCCAGRACHHGVAWPTCFMIPFLHEPRPLCSQVSSAMLQMAKDPWEYYRWTEDAV